MEGIGLVETQYYTFARPPRLFQLESGVKISPIIVAYEIYGELNSKGDNAILILHALTGDAHAAGKKTPEERASGWWDQMIGPGRPFDTNRYFVLCSNVLGSCYGTTGPASEDSVTGERYRMDFPVVTIRDMVRVQKALLEHLGVRRLVTATGGSMGGMQALEWAVTYPDFLDSVIPIATCGRMSPFGISYNEVQRRAILMDPKWQNGQYDPADPPAEGLGLARMIGTITYKSDLSFTMKFGRTFTGSAREDYFRFNSRFEVENYLQYQGDKLVKRFDANAYLYLTKAMDLHDVGRGYESYEQAMARIKAPLLAIGINSDFLYLPHQQQEVVNILQKHGRPAQYVELDSPYGHDSFLIEFDMMAPIIRDFLAQVRS
ncbi:MAG: homoserine O-acetyltransferase MetX [Bacillota bacterium]